MIKGLFGLFYATDGCTVIGFGMCLLSVLVLCRGSDHGLWQKERK